MGGTRVVAEQLDDRRLAARTSYLVQRGEYHDAPRRLTQHHGTAVFRYCREALRDAALAEDIQQQVFIEAYRNLGRFSGHSSLSTWLPGPVLRLAAHRLLAVICSASLRWSTRRGPSRHS